MSTFLLLLLLLACPLMMWLMMRGGHGHGGHGHGGQGPDVGIGSTSIDDLRRQRDELDEEIAARERPRDDIGRAPVTEK